MLKLSKKIKTHKLPQNLKPILKNSDIFGKAVSDFYHQNQPENITVISEDFDDDQIPVEYLFRNYTEMPLLEQRALELSFGKVLDVGCCAGSHALYLQQEKKLDVKAIDIAEGAVEIAKLRGVEQAEVQDFFKLKNEKFDTILMLMNGSGIIGKLKNLNTFFKHAKNLLTENGQILLDSSDLKYLLDTEEDGGVWVDLNEGYYGELSYQTAYKGEVSQKFDWLYVDFYSLQLAANSHGFSCEILQEGEHYDYLAMLKIC